VGNGIGRLVSIDQRYPQTEEGLSFGGAVGGGDKMMRMPLGLVYQSHVGMEAGLLRHQPLEREAR
jgi:hypothetical protein